MKKETWIFAVFSNNEYEVSSHGRVRSLFYNGIKRNIPMILKYGLSETGYRQVTIRFKTSKKTWRVHRLILSSFDKCMPSNIYCRHLDDNRLNNKLSNLAWGTAKDNMDDRIKNGIYPLGDTACNVKLKSRQVLKIRELYSTGKLRQFELARKYKVSPSAIKGIVHRRVWKHI